MSQSDPQNFCCALWSFGYPHLYSQSQVTEPFWNQYPLWTCPEDLIEFYPTAPSNDYYTYAMETKPLIIGSNSRYSRKGQQMVEKPKSKPKRNGMGVVNVYSKGVFIGQMPFTLLVRFSKAAQEAFPKQKPAENDENPAEDDEKAAAVVDWADDEDEKIDMARVTADIAKLQKPSGDEAMESVDGIIRENRRRVKILDVGTDEMWYQPPIYAFDFAFEWMRSAKHASRGDKVLPYTVPNPSGLPLWKLLDFYAAAVALNLRPDPAQLRAELFSRLSENPPSIDDITSVHARLPASDRVVTRMINSFLDKRAKGKQLYSKAQRDEIEDYIYEAKNEDLRERFEEIEKDRKEKWKARHLKTAAEELQKLAEGTDRHMKGEGAVVLHGQGPSIHANGANTNRANADGRYASGNKRRSRNRRKQQASHNGSGVAGNGGGKPVSGHEGSAS